MTTTDPVLAGAATLDRGQRIDRYTIEEPIGEGGMGRVFRAHDERLDRRVALKLVSVAGAGTAPDDEARARLLREARAASRLDHPNVVGVFDVGDCEHGPYIVMELVPGRSLRAAIDAGDLAMAERLRILREVAVALAAAHDAGIVHRDVKPENVIVRPDGRVKVLDFGIARAAARDVAGDGPTGPSLPTLTTRGAALGTPRYMAPEQIKGGPVDGRTDQFGWGVLAYELLDGRPPFSGVDALGTMAAVLTEEPPAMRGASAAVAAVVSRALRKEPSERHPAMRDVIAALDAASGASASAASAPASTAPGTAPGAAAGAPASAELAAAGRVVPAGAPGGPPVTGPAGGWGSTGPGPVTRGMQAFAGTPGVAPASPVDLVRPPTLSRRWSARELEEIFDRALAVQRTGYGYDEVVAAAHAIGVDDAAMHAAMRQLERRGAVEPRADLLLGQHRGLARHAGIWLAVSFGLFLMNVFDPSSVWWFQWTMISWGIAVAIHAVVSFTRGPRRHKPGRRTKDPMIAADAAEVARFLEASHAPVRIAPVAGGARIAAAGPRRGDGLTAELEAMAEEEAAARRDQGQGRAR